MESATSPRKKLRSPAQDIPVNPKTSITCLNVPEGLFDANAAKKHFSKFGRVQRIRLFPKRKMCIIEYDQPTSAERAVLNAGAFDGFMFDVTRSKARVRRRSKKDDDPDWVPDSEVEEELSAMGGTSSYRITRQSTEGKNPLQNNKELPKPMKLTSQPVIKKKIAVAYHPSIKTNQATSVIEPPIHLPTTQSSLSTTEAATELHELRCRISLTPDEQWRTLEARDRILRGWGGAGSRVKVGGATIGTCPDMCPEKEILHRQAEHQVMFLETVPDSDGLLDSRRTVKQYSRSSADQEIPMCYELRPAPVLMRTCAYLLHEIADTKRQVSLADWFHFMWDRFRSIRKDITQQAMCCADSIRLVEMCARFHAHCAARLADLEHTQFDQKLNTDNLTKCLQTLKHMYADVGSEHKPNEAEFRGYIALLNLGDANFWWEIKQLPHDIQKSAPLIFATQVFNAIDNNNYVRFFRLVQHNATYLQACILLRYFNDVRARALARIVKAYAPRGGSRFPAEDLMDALAFESVESMHHFINHYGLRFAKIDDSELTIILDRNQFIEDSDPYPISRAISLIESKREQSVGELIAGGSLPSPDFLNHQLFTSFTKEGKLKESALLAEDQGYNTINDSNKDIQVLKNEITRLGQGERLYKKPDAVVEQKNLFVKPESKTLSPGKSLNTFVGPKSGPNQFSFKPAIPVASTDVIKNSPEKVFESTAKNVFSFSKPQESVGSSMFPTKNVGNLFKQPNVFKQHVFGKPECSNAVNHQESVNLDNSNLSKQDLGKPEIGNIFKQSPFASQTKSNENIFDKPKDSIIFAKPDSTVKFDANNFFANASATAKEIFGAFNKTNNFSENTQKNIFLKPNTGSVTKTTLLPNSNENESNKSPGSIFKQAIMENGNDFIFNSKIRAPSVAHNIFNSMEDKRLIDKVEKSEKSMYQNYNENNMNKEIQEEIMKEEERKELLRREELQRRLEEEKKRKEEEARQKEEETRRIEEERRRIEALKKQEEIKRLEEKRSKEKEEKERELRIKLAREAELKRKAAEAERMFKERVDNESSELVNEFISELSIETVSLLIKEERQILNNLISYASTVAEEILTELNNEITFLEMKAVKFRFDKLRRKCFTLWKKQANKNVKRRNLLDDTPVWLTNCSPLEEAIQLRRFVENATLKNMNAVHRGYKFSGELKLIPSPKPFNMMEIIRSPLLKRMKQINYPYDKCFFWKVTLVSPGPMKWLYRKIELEKWLLDVFSDRQKHEASDSLIHVGKQSWNHLMEFAISVSLMHKDRTHSCNEAMEGTNGLLMYTTEKEIDLTSTVETIVKNKYPYQIVPVAIIMPKAENLADYSILESLLTNLQNNKLITAFKIFMLDPQNISNSLSLATKTALKWLAKKCPQNPPIEIDLLKSICQRYLGNEIWCNLKSEQDSRMSDIRKDLQKLIQCYNSAVDKLTNVITNEDLFNYPLFPLEFKVYLDDKSPYPKPYEFIPCHVKSAENISAIKDIMKQLKLPIPTSDFHPLSITGMQQQIRKYCNQIGWFDNPEEVVCRVVALLPNEFSDLDMPHDQFIAYFAHYDLIDILNIIVYEKINRLKNFDNRYAIYEKVVLDDYRNMNWLFDIDVLRQMKHKAIECDDDIDYLIEAKRRKIAMDSMEYLMLEDKDCTLVEESIKASDDCISRYDNCSETVKQLEQQIENEKKKSIELENLLKLALSDV